MSFRDFNDEGPGTFGWDFVLGGNTTGLFPEEMLYEVNGDELTQLTFRHIGGGRYEPVYGSSWTMENMSPVQGTVGSRSFTFEQGGCKFRATENSKFKTSADMIVDIAEI